MRVFLDLKGIDILGISLINCWKKGLSIAEKAISSATIHRIKFFSNSLAISLLLYCRNKDPIDGIDRDELNKPG